MKSHATRAVCLALLLPLVAIAASPARTELQAAMQATPNLEHGSELFAQCVSCHGADGGGVRDGSIPRIAGQHAHVLIKQLVDFRYGKRWDFRMEQRAGTHLGAAQDIADVSGYLSMQPRLNQSGQGNGEQLAQGAGFYGAYCASCHGAEAEGDGKGAVPLLAGQHYGYLMRQMYDAVDGRRPTLNELHARRLEPLDFEQVRAVADFLSRISPSH
jgi:cytochrome c553